MKKDAVNQQLNEVTNEEENPEGVVVSPDDSYEKILKNLIEMLKKQGITVVEMDEKEKL